MTSFSRCRSLAAQGGLFIMKTITTIFAAAAVLAVAGGAAAQSGQIIRVGDDAMDCPGIIAAANQAAEILGGAPEGGVFGSEEAINAATGLAMQGAIMSGAGRAIPGMGMLGNALGAAARQRREQQEAARLVAQQRWYYLNGLYAGRDCDRVLAEAQAAGR